MSLALKATVVAAGLCALGPVAMAQTSPSAAAGTPAPVGHRQPTRADLPPDTARAEIDSDEKTKGAAGRDDLGVPNICPACGR